MSKPEEDGIPIIDFSPWSNNRTQEEKTQVSRQIYEAFSTIGFIILVNHGVRGDDDPKEGVTAKAFAASKQFFALDRDTKMKSAYLSTASNRGYIAMGQEKFDAVLPDIKETFDIGFEGESAFKNRWPEDTELRESFKHAMLDYFVEYDRLHLNILLALARGMGLDDEYFTPLCNGNHQNLRLLHYPECSRDDIQNGVQKRGGIHTDYGTLTLVSQQDVSGLVAQRLDGTWVSIPCVPGGVVVNVGEMLQRWSNDILRATPHQVLDDDPVMNGSTTTTTSPRSDRVPERYSIAFFCNANKETSLECLPVCHGPDRPPKYKAINAFEYLTMRLNSTIPVVLPPG